MAAVTQLITAQQLFEMPGMERFELVRGECVPMSPLGFDHGGIAVEVAAALRDFVRAGKLGTVVVESGFWLSRDPDTVCSPDVAFVRAERIPPGGVRAFFEGPPDLAVEVISPDDRASEVLAKAQDWLRAGCPVVWAIDPQTNTATIYSPEPRATLLSIEDTLVCEEVLPGFRLPISQLFGG